MRMATSSSTRRILGGTMETAASFEVRNAPSSYPTVADDERTREVGLRYSSYEAGEQSAALCGASCRGVLRSGAGGAKGGDQGECGPAKHAPDTGSGKRVTGAGAHTESRKGKEEGEVHRALPPHQHRPARRGVLCTQGERRPGCGSTDLEGLRGRPRAQSRGFARSGPSGSVSGVAQSAGVHTQAGRSTTPACGRCFGGQDRPTGSGRTAECDLRGGLPRSVVRIPAGARNA